MIQVGDITDLVLGEAAVVHPDWLLAAWSVDQSGLLTQDRATASALVRSMIRGLSTSTSDSAIQAFAGLFFIGFFSTHIRTQVLEPQEERGLKGTRNWLVAHEEGAEIGKLHVTASPAEQGPARMH